jgi:hypothetical protein
LSIRFLLGFPFSPSHGETPVAPVFSHLWTGKGQGGLIGIGVDNFYGSKETAMAWIDGIVPKITKGK